MGMPDGGLASLAEDLILLSIRPSGAIINVQRLEHAVMGAELVRLAAAGRVSVVADSVVILDAAPASWGPVALTICRCPGCVPGRRGR